MPTVAQGGTVRLPAVYRDATNALVDPVNPELEIINPSAATVAEDLIPVRESVGQYHYDYAVAALAPLGTWVARWTGIINGFTVAGDEEFEVVEPGSVGSLGSILSLEEYKSLAGIDPTDDRKDSRIVALIPAVEQAISTFCDRKFVVASGVSSERTFEFRGEDIVDIDDCVSVSEVTTDAGVLGAVYDLDNNQWTAQPGDSTPTYYYLRVHSGPFNSFSPEMGFERNLDQYPAFEAKPVTISVTADWGWPSIPHDVKLAAVWMIQDIIDKPGGDNLQSEGIEGFNRSWAGSFASLSIPNRARDLLANYQRVF